MEILGIDWVGINPENGRKLLLSVIFIVVVLLVSKVVKSLFGKVTSGTHDPGVQGRFWMRQGVSLLSAVVLILGLLSIWFNDPARLATAFGLMSAGLAFALQQVITALAGYFVILRGSTFTIGDRISMGGVRGDVMRLGFIQTTIMEMGQPPSVQAADPAMWVKSRQFTGRIVTVSNSRIFSEPVFNYTREFPYIWEEMTIPITFKEKRGLVEEILLKSASSHGIDIAHISAEESVRIQSNFGLGIEDMSPRVYFRITDNWLELTVRFLVGTHSIRSAKDAMSREIVERFEAEGIGIASGTYDIVGFPPIEIRRERARA
jgi:small-conductance mechanosensitive channel